VARQSASSYLSDKHNGRVGVVVGNGISRKSFDLNDIRAAGVVMFGCNALYRDIDADYICAFDTEMLRELSMEYSGAVIAEPVQEIAELGIMQPWWLEYDGTKVPNSGAMALWCALFSGCNPVYLLGFDGNPVTSAGSNNNIYVGSKNYDIVYHDPAAILTARKGDFELVMCSLGPRALSVTQVGTERYDCPSISGELFMSMLFRPDRPISV